jgi:hypothetical protein
MNNQADELVQEIAGMIFKSAQDESNDWKRVLARFQFFEGACKDTYSWISFDNEVNFYFPSMDMEIAEKAELLREVSAVDDKQWVVSLVSISSNGDINIDFEYDNSNRWDPQKFVDLV